MPSLAVRRRQELDAKLKSLERELDEWELRTSEEPMRRHYSQLRRIKGILDGLLDSMKESSGWSVPAITDEAVLAKAVAWERRILTAHAIWEVFRSKLAQRFETGFQTRLMACDDLAWACYEPAMTRFSTAKKEPPLVYLNSTWSAFLRRRNVSFEKDVDAGKDARDTLEEADYRETLKRLPIPLLGLPWFQVAHPPSALLIAHEIGHAVEFDFDLTATIDNALRAMHLQFDADWRSCASEVFADLYGCLCLGRYFAGSLLDLLVADKTIVTAEADFGAYPTRGFRVELAVNALIFLGLDEDAAQIRQTWESVYGSMQTLLDHRADAEKVVAAIYGNPGVDMASVLRPPTANITALAQSAAFGNSTELNKESDTRVLFCALREAYETYTPQKSARAADLLITQMLKKNAGFRFRGSPATAQQDVKTQLAGLAEEDLKAGRDLARALRLDPDQDDELATAGP